MSGTPHEERVASYHVADGRLIKEVFSKSRDANGYWLLGYLAVFPGRIRTIEVKPGETRVLGQKMVVDGEVEARTYIHCLDMAKRAVEWNAEAPKDVISREAAIERFHALIEWAAAGTSSSSLSHHGISMDRPVMVGGYPVWLTWTGMINAVYAYEKHWDLPDIARRHWALPSPGPEARQIVEAAGMTVGNSWNGDRSMPVGIYMHDSVKAAFQTDHEKKRALGGRLEGAAKLPKGWGR